METSTESPGFDASLLIQAQELVHVGTWTWDVATDTVRWSDELFRLVGLAPQSLAIGLATYLSFVHPGDREAVSNVIGEALRTRAPFRYDCRLQRADGTWFHSHVRGCAIVDEMGTVSKLLGTAMDTTDHWEQEAALRASEVQLRSIFEQSAVGLALTDAAGRFVSVNASFASFLGETPDALMGRSFVDVTHPADVELTQRMAEYADTTRRSVTYEKRYVRRDGSAAWARATITRVYDAEGIATGFVAVIEDITLRKLGTETLAQQSEFLETIMNHMPVMVSVVDHDGNAQYVNREWERVFGLTLREAQESELITRCYPDPSDAERVLAAIRRGVLQWQDFDPLGKDGRAIPSSWASINLSDGTTLMIGQDMRERRQLQERLMQSQKMEALGQLAGGVAHDFNNLLTIISACASFVLEASPPEDVTVDVKEILSASGRAAGLTRQLLAFSRRQMLKTEIVDVNASVEAMEKSLGRLIGENIEIVVTPNAKHGTVEVDVHQLEQVILNLAVNARDAMADGGTISIETGNTTVVATDGTEREYVAISVTDTGTGIEPAIRDRLFDPFFTTKAVGKGTGLGLAIVHGIVQQSGGIVEVESVLGEGSTFRILLPTCSSDNCAVMYESGADQLRGSETILLVEDEAVLRSVMRRVLRDHGYAVLEARHGGDAALLSTSFEGRIDLLVTDLIMPELGGRELAELVRTQRPGTPVLYVSGYTDDELLRKGVLERGAQLLRKPFVPSELALAVRQLLNEQATVTS